MAQTRLSRRGGVAAGIPLPGAIRRAGGSHAPLRVPGIFERSGSHRSAAIEQIRTKRSAGWQPAVSPIVNRQTAGPRTVNPIVLVVVLVLETRRTNRGRGRARRRRRRNGSNVRRNSRGRCPRALELLESGSRSTKSEVRISKPETTPKPEIQTQTAT